MNAMNDNPETDALQIRLRDSDFRDSYIVMLGHAQKLERERNALRERVAILESDNVRLQRFAKTYRNTAEENGKAAHAAQCQVVELLKALETSKQNP